jgi:hypothetical protein
VVTIAQRGRSVSGESSGEIRYAPSPSAPSMGSTKMLRTNSSPSQPGITVVGRAGIEPATYGLKDPALKPFVAALLATAGELPGNEGRRQRLRVTIPRKIRRERRTNPDDM